MLERVSVRDIMTLFIAVERLSQLNIETVTCSGGSSPRQRGALISSSSMSPKHVVISFSSYLQSPWANF